MDVLRAMEFFLCRHCYGEERKFLSPWKDKTSKFFQFSVEAVFSFDAECTLRALGSFLTVPYVRSLLDEPQVMLSFSLAEFLQILALSVCELYYSLIYCLLF